MLEKLHLYTRNYSLCSSILRKRITQSNSNTSNSTNHFYSFFHSHSFHPFVCVFFAFCFFPLFIFQLFGSAAQAPLCQRNKLSVCQISVQRLRWSIAAIMHNIKYNACTFRLRTIHSFFPFIISLFSFSHCTQKCARTYSAVWITFFWLGEYFCFQIWASQYLCFFLFLFTFRSHCILCIA